MNVEKYYQPTQHTHAHDMSGLPTLTRASVIIFVIICKVQLSAVYKS